MSRAGSVVVSSPGWTELAHGNRAELLSSPCLFRSPIVPPARRRLSTCSAEQLTCLCSGPASPISTPNSSYVVVRELKKIHRLLCRTIAAKENVILDMFYCHFALFSPYYVKPDRVLVSREETNVYKWFVVSLC